MFYGSVAESFVDESLEALLGDEPIVQDAFKFQLVQQLLDVSCRFDL